MNTWTNRMMILATGVFVAVYFSLSGILASDLNPDTEADRVLWWKMESLFGPIPAAPQGTSVGAIVKTMANPYWRNMAMGYEHAAARNGVRVDIVSVPTEVEHVEQMNVANHMLKENYALYLVSPQTDGTLRSFFESAAKDKLPVVNVDDAVYSKADYYVGTSQYAKGALAAEWFVRRFPDGGTFAVIEGRAGVYAVRQRTNGFVETLLKAGEKYEVVDIVTADWDRGLAQRQAAVVLTRFPRLSGFYCSNDTMALGVADAVATNLRLGETLVVGTDGIDEAYAAIRSGMLGGTVDSFPAVTGMAALGAGLRILAGQAVPRVVETPQALISRENLDKYQSDDPGVLLRLLHEEAEALEKNAPALR